MATVTKPIALDESLNTTELSSRNVADVLAQELSAVATAIGGISAPSAEDVSYDNSGSGLSANNVQDAIDEVKGNIPTVNNGTLTIQQNGTSKGSFTANSASNVNVNIETPTADKKTATDQFITADGGLLSKCMIDLVPVQSGSGDPSPDNIRPISGHTEVDLQVDGKNFISYKRAGRTNSGVVYTVNNGVVTANGLATARSYSSSTSSASIATSFLIKAGTYILSGAIQNTSIALYTVDENGTVTNLGESTYNTPLDVTLTEDSYVFYNIIVENGTSINHTFSVQLEKGSTATNYEPYLVHLYQVQIGSTVYGGYVDLVSGVMTATHALIDYDGSEDESWWKNSTSGYRITISDCKDESFANSDCITNEFTRGESAYDNLKCGITHKYFTIGDTNSTKWADVTALKTWLSSNPLQVVYELATPQTIQLTPQQIETLAGQNNLSTPLSGQSIETNGVEYKELFTFADVKSYVDKKIPDAPTTDGTYTLQAVVSGGVPTYSWI